jgi:tetratricopeptide (TPR) repeat protein
MDDVSTVEANVRRLRRLLDQRCFTAAKAAAESLLTTLPENRDVLYMYARVQRELGEVPAALETLGRLQQLYPRFSRGYQELGFCHIVLRQAPEAIAAFAHAVTVSPALPASWSMLEGLYRKTGQAAAAAEAAAHVSKLRELPADVVKASALFWDGELDRAEQLIRCFLLEHGHHVEAMRLLAHISMERETFEDAQVLLEAVLELSPEYHAARFDYAHVLTQRHLYRAAQEQTQRLLGIDGENRGFRTLHALTQVGLGKHEKAIELYRQLLLGTQQPAELHLSIAHLLKTQGKTDAAIAEYRAAISSRIEYGDAYWSLANLKTYRFTEEEVKRMTDAVSDASTSVTDRYHLSFALGKSFEDGKQYEQSFTYYDRGNALKRSTSLYRVEQFEHSVRLQMAVCTPQLMSRHSGSGASAAEPIFIVGLPRAGSTLIEQILASHSEVEGTHELADVPRIADELNGRSTCYPEVLSSMSSEDFRRLGERYLNQTRAYRLTGRPRFIDKMPNNFKHIGLIHLMLPNARIIDVRREPMACCFGNFKQLFAQGQEFTYSLEDISRYYRAYLELMCHWDEVLPARVLRVHYEDVVADLDGNVRRLLEFCGLDFQPACIEYHRTERSIRTASSEQVRRPIYRDGLSLWRNFEPWLEPLRIALGDALIRYRDVHREREARAR